MCFSSRKRKPLNTPVASEKTSAALPVLVVAISVAVMSLGCLGSRYFIPVNLSALLFYTFPFVSQHNNAGEVFFQTLHNNPKSFLHSPPFEGQLVWKHRLGGL
jgi:hypothetical protein